MAHENRRQVRLPARLVGELTLALDQALRQIESLAGSDPGVVTQQVHEFGERTLAEARRRLAGKTDDERGGNR